MSERAEQEPRPLRLIVRARRQALGISQERVAKLLGITRLNWLGVEGGRRRMRADELVAIAKFFGITLDDLVYGDPAQKQSPKSQEAA